MNKIIFILSIYLSIGINCFALNFKDYINADYPAVEKNAEEIRNDYIECFNFDMWYPYFKIKEIEHMLCERMTFENKNCKVSPEVGNKYKKFMYQIKWRF